MSWGDHTLYLVSNMEVLLGYSSVGCCRTAAQSIIDMLSTLIGLEYQNMYWFHRSQPVAACWERIWKASHWIYLSQYSVLLWWPLLGLLSRCPTFKSSHYNSFEDRAFMPNHQLSCRDLTGWQGTRIDIIALDCPLTCPILQCSAIWYNIVVIRYIIFTVDKPHKRHPIAGTFIRIWI